MKVKTEPLWGNSNPPPGIKALMSKKESVQRVSAAADDFEMLVLELQRSVHSSVDKEHMVGATIALGQVAAIIRFYKPENISPTNTPDK